MDIVSICSEEHFLDHVEPVWRALPGWLRGVFHVPANLAEECSRRGLPCVPWRGDGPATRSIPSARTPVLVASAGDLRRARTGCINDPGRPATIMEHGAGQTYRYCRCASYAGGPGRRACSLALVPGPHPRDAYARSLHPQLSCEMVGLVKLETLQALGRAPRGPRPVVCFSFHWDVKLHVDVLHATWDYWLPALRRMARDGRWDLLGHSHPRSWEHLSRVYEQAGIEPVREFSEVLRRADLYCVDNSSTAFEFPAVTGCPTLLLDHPGWENPRQHGLRFAEAGDGLCRVDNPNRLEEAVNQALRDEPRARERREAALDMVYVPRTGGAQRAAEAIMSRYRIEVAQFW